MQSFNLNMDRPGEYVLYAKQGDSNSRFVRLALSSGGVAYVPPVGSSMTIRYGAPNMPKGWYDTIELEDGTTRPAVTQNGNVVTLELAPQLLAVPGENRVCFLFHGAEDYQLGSWNFKLLIEGDPNPDAVQSEEYINISASTLSKVAEVAAEIAATNQALATHVGDKSNPHAVTAAQVGARPDTWLPTSAEIGAAPMEYAKKVGAPHNYLVNSDFSNPVRYKGSGDGTVAAWGGQTVSQWYANASGATWIQYGASIGLTGGIYQNVKHAGELHGSIVTFAAMINNQVYCCSGKITFNNAWARVARFESGGNIVEINVQSNNEMWCSINGANDAIVAWAALYEGEYTADTVPTYQRKGYAIELLECNVSDAENTSGAKVLWENASPTSAFAAQTINVDLSTAKAITIVYAQATGGNNEFTFHRDLDNWNTVSAARYDNAVYITHRTTGVNWNGNQIEFETGYQNGTAGDGRMIPIAVFSIA